MMLFIVLLLFMHSASSRSMRDNNTGFDHFMFSREWPVSMCIGNNMSFPPPHVCRINKNVTGWSIHGLWPTRNMSHKPQFCNCSLHFNITLLKPIIGDLLKYWANMWADKSADSFWEHEWMKHGTCAITVPEFGNEYKYFKQCLDLNKQFNMSSILAKSGIVPSSHSYEYTEVLKAFDKDVLLFCVQDMTVKVQYLTEVHICLTKSKQWIDCPDALKQRHGRMKRSVYSTSKHHPHTLILYSLCSDIIPIMYPMRHDHIKLIG